MRVQRTVVMAILIAVSAASGCATTDDDVRVSRSPAEPPPSAPATTAPAATYPVESVGLDRAARNHVESAYRFLVKDMPKQALKELEKAGRKGGQGFWLHYYLGGAHYLNGDYGVAIRSWDAAYDATKDQALRSRLRTCQSYAQYGMANQQLTQQLLEVALELDRKNIQAAELLGELNASVEESAGKPGPKKGKPAKGRKAKAAEEEPECVEIPGMESRRQFRAYFLVEM